MLATLFFLIFPLLVSANLPTPYQSFRIDELHNNYRMNVFPPARNMPAIFRSQSLAQSSNNWASRCIWGHSGTPGVGENIYAISIRSPNTSAFNVDIPVQAWGSEKPYYFYNTNTCATGQVCGHYTQMIWANTRFVGCAIQDCPIITNLGYGGTYVVCQYSPPGNFGGQRPYVAADWTINWQPFGGLLMKYISTRAGFVWGVNPNNQVYKLVNNVWTLQQGSLINLGTTEGNSIWGIGIRGNIAYYTDGIPKIMPLPPNNKGIIQIDGINENSAVMVDTGSTVWYYFNKIYYNLGIGFKWISQGLGYDIWAVGGGGKVYRWTPTVGRWVQQPGQGLANIHVADLQNIVATANNGTLWRLQYGQWVQLPGTGKQISMSNGIVYRIDTANNVYRSG